jgi:outer membrane protein TolC
LDASIEALNLQKLNLENTIKQFQAGQTDSLSVSQQQDTLTQSEQSVLTNQIAYLNDITNFRQLLQTTLKHWNIKLKY